MTNGTFIFLCFVLFVLFFSLSVFDYDWDESWKLSLVIAFIAFWLMTCAICWRVGYRRGVNETETYHIIKSAQQGEVQK